MIENNLPFSEAEFKSGMIIFTFLQVAGILIATGSVLFISFSILLIIYTLFFNKTGKYLTIHTIWFRLHALITIIFLFLLG